ncbi:hypothetical protein Adt_21469 [Abeliophyllum distichum]|uniref:Uncharacterized protein n=1 Tax=Abeliophyllum distichum TaxID=126358 RepID=A0ABD1SZT7_9LAMI
MSKKNSSKERTPEEYLLKCLSSQSLKHYLLKNPKIFFHSNEAFSYNRIVRRCKVKWWKKFNESNAWSKAIQSWINQHIKTKAETSSSQTDFLAEKIKIMARLEKCSDPKEFAVLVHKAASMVKTESSKGTIAASEVGFDPNFEQDNEDD